MSRGKKMRAELNDKQIESISSLQRFTYRCIKMFNNDVNETPAERTYEEKLNIMNRWSTKLFGNSEFEIVFDETVWPTDDSGAKENIVKVLVDDKMPGYSSVTIDFKKGFHNCVKFYSGEDEMDINIFDVQYTEHGKG